jgi:tetratricopeptide (TPR) repeat protein
MKGNRIFWLLSLVALAFSACSGMRTADKEKPAPPHVTSAEYNYFYLEALRLQNKGDYASAFDLFSHCLELDSLAPDTYYQLAAYYSDLDNDSMTSVCLKKAVRLNPKNDYYHERLAQWYIQSQDFAKAIDAYEQLFDNNRSRSDVLLILLRLYQQQKNYGKMLTTIARIEQIEGTSEQITLAKMQVYQMKGDKQSAYNALKQLADDHPNDINYKVMMGNWLLQNERTEEARKIFLKAQEDEPNNEYVAASLYDFYRLNGEDSLANVYRDRILLNKYTATRTKITMLQNVIDDNEKHGRDSTKVLELLDEMMKADPTNADIAHFNASYIAAKNMPREMQDSAFYHVLDIAPDQATARLQLLRMKWSDEDWDEIISLCKPALEYNPDEMVFCYFLGMAYYQKKDNPKALEAFRTGVSRINDSSDKDIVSDFYALMGDINHEMGNREEAYAAYDSCLQWKPDNMGCLNNYAYFLSVEGGDLKKAETMSLKTIAKEPNNPTFLDTYAWILYCEERYTEAKEFIDRTIEKMDSTENNSTLYDHAGDIYAACGETEKAVEYWKQAIDAGSDNEAVIRKKIRKYEK